VTGAVAIGVTWLTHLFTATREDAKRDRERLEARKALLRNKLEDLVTLVSEHIDFREASAMHILVLGAHLSAGQKADHLEPPEDKHPLDRAGAIQAMYFPPLDDWFQSVLAADKAAIDFGAAEINRLAAGVPSWVRESQPTFGTRVAESLAPLRNARRALTDKARTMVQGELLD
jgi:hypothetical protein